VTSNREDIHNQFLTIVTLDNYLHFSLSNDPDLVDGLLRELDDFTQFIGLLLKHIDKLFDQGFFQLREIRNKPNAKFDEFLPIVLVLVFILSKSVVYLRVIPTHLLEVFWGKGGKSAII